MLVVLETFWIGAAHCNTGRCWIIICSQSFKFIRELFFPLTHSYKGWNWCYVWQPYDKAKINVFPNHPNSKWPKAMLGFDVDNVILHWFSIGIEDYTMKPRWTRFDTTEDFYLLIVVSHPGFRNHKVDIFNSYFKYFFVFEIHISAYTKQIHQDCSIIISDLLKLSKQIQKCWYSLRYNISTPI